MRTSYRDIALLACCQALLLINNAGQARSAQLSATDDALWQSMMAVNLTGTFICMRECLPDMLKLGFGRIVNIASTAGLTGYPYVGAYCAAKHGVIGLTRALALEGAPRGVTVNAVVPSIMDTPANRAAMPGADYDRWPKLDDVAAVYVFLASPAAGLVSGAAIPVYGQS